MSMTALWEKVCMTDPSYTKEFNRGGGFKGTAINPTYQIMRATDVLGPVGVFWGWRIDQESYVPGAEGDVNHVLRVTVWYKITPKLVELIPELEPALGQVAEIVHFGQTAFVGRNKYGPFTDEEAPKKSLTDAILKALSCLGFSADIHLGFYDSSKYVNDRRAQFGGEKSAAPAQAREVEKPVPLVWDETMKGIVMEGIASLKSEQEAREYWKEVVQLTHITSAHTVEYTELKGLFNARITQLRAASTSQ